MGCASSDLIEMIIKKHKTEIESAKIEVERQKKETPNKCITIVLYFTLSIQNYINLTQIS